MGDSQVNISQGIAGSTSAQAFPEQGQHSVPLVFREWTPLVNLLDKIPEKAKRGFQILDLEITCVAAVEEFIALGTNVGLVYWYNRKLDTLERLKFEGTAINPITCITVASCENYMIAAGNTDGIVTIFQIPKFIPKEDQTDGTVRESMGPFPETYSTLTKVQVFIVREVHRSLITALNWSSNGMILFSGDKGGIVAETAIDFTSGISKSSKLLEEAREIVQLGYLHRMLLISTSHRTVLYSRNLDRIVQIGNQERKISGSFGAVFQTGLWSSKKLRLYTSRPGLRIWVADEHGCVQNTLMFKDLLKNDHATIPILNPAKLKKEQNVQHLNEKQFGILQNFMTTYLVTWYNNTLYILDPVKVAVIASCNQFRSIISVSVFQDEIFVLETSRILIRISTGPEDPVTPTNNPPLNNFLFPGNIPEIKIPEKPFKLLASKIKETSKVLPKFNSAFINTVRNVLETDINIQDGQFVQNVIPMGASPNTPDYLIQAPSPVTPELQKSQSQKIEKFNKITENKFDDLVVTQFKPEKKRYKSKRNGYAHSDSMSVSSQGSLTSEGVEEQQVNKLSLEKRFPQSISTPMICNDNISPQDVQSKEETLGKLLNWSEFFTETNGNQLGDEINEEITDSSKNSNPVINSTVFPDSSSQNALDIRSDMGEDKNYQQNEMKLILDDNFKRENSEDKEDFLIPSSECTARTSVIDGQESFGTYGAHSKPFDFFGPPSGSSQCRSSAEVSLNQSSTMSTLLNNSIAGNENESISNENPILETILPIQDMEISGTLLADSWIKFDCPCKIASLSISEKYIFCVDSENSVYFSDLTQLSEYKLRWIKSKFQANHVITSYDSSIILKIYDTRVYLLRSSPEPLFQNNEWDLVLENVSFATIGCNNFVFLLLLDNTIRFCEINKHLHERKQVWTLEDVSAPPGSPLLSIYLSENALWSLTKDGKIWFKPGISQNNPHGEEWMELSVSDLPPATAFGIGPNSSLWISDSQNQVRLIQGAEQGKFSTWTICISEDLVQNGSRTDTEHERPSSALAQWTQRLTESFGWGPSFSVSNENLLPILSSCCSAFAFALKGGTSLFLNNQFIKGHRWETVPFKNSSSKLWKWSNVHAGSVFNDHGFIWLEESTKGKLFYIRGRKGPVQPIDVPFSKIVCIAAAPEALWVLDDQGMVHARCNISSSNELGDGWDKIELSSIPCERKLKFISCGAEIVWACDDVGNIYFRNGTLNPPSSTDISPAWIQVDGPSDEKVVFNKVYVSADNRLVWALNNEGVVYAREAVFPEHLVGIDWVLIPFVEVTSLSLSESAVWALTARGEIFRRCGISEMNLFGDYWQLIPGSAKMHSVSVSDEAWILDSNGTLLQYETTYLRLNSLLELDFHEATKNNSFDDEDRNDLLTDYEVIKICDD